MPPFTGKQYAGAPRKIGEPLDPKLGQDWASNLPRLDQAIKGAGSAVGAVYPPPATGDSAEFDEDGATKEGAPTDDGNPAADRMAAYTPPSKLRKLKMKGR